MKNIFLLLLILPFSRLTVYAQDFSRQEADSMINALKKSKQDIDRINLLSGIAQFHIFKPGDKQIDLDSAGTFIREAKSLNKMVRSSTAEGNLLLTESYLFKIKGKQEEGKGMVEKAVGLLRSGNNSSFLGWALYELSTYYNFQDSIEYLITIDLINQSVAAFEKARDYKGKGNSLERLGDMQIVERENDKAIATLEKAIAAYDSIQYPKKQMAYLILARGYKNKRNFSQTLFYLLKSLKTAQATNDTTYQMAYIYDGLGTLYFLIERYETSEFYSQQALKLATQYKDEYLTFYLSMNLSYTYGFLGQFEKALQTLAIIPPKYLTSTKWLDRMLLEMCYTRAYMDLKQFSNAQLHCDTLLRIVNNEWIPGNNKSNAYRLIGNYYFNLSQFSQSRTYINKAIELADEYKFRNGRIMATKFLYKLDSAEGNYPAAFSNLVFYKAKTDSINQEKKERQFDILKVEYEVEMKEDSIKLMDNDITLLTQRNTLQQATLKRQRLIKNVTIAGIFVALLITGLLYRQFIQKKKSNKLITQQNDQLQHYLTEKEWLLKEIHHRVKNNLQIVMSLLNSQSVYIDNDAALTAIHDSQHRVHAMSLIHQKLYNTENVSTINMSSYIREMATYLSESFNTGQRIRFEYSIDPLEMDVSQAIPLGLILNEAITNAIKYAFPDSRKGVVSVTLSNTDPDNYLLSISDNGVGMPPDLNNKKPGSLGMSLMNGLSRELDGNFSIENNNGTTVKISFTYDPGIKRPNTLAQSFASNN